MRDTTLLFLIKKEHEKITDICLAMKKRGFGIGRYNGVGGKLHEGETIEAALIRETKEEIGVTVTKEDMKKCAAITFTFPHNPPFDQLVHVYLAEKWTDEPRESEEMNPSWFKVEDIPYGSMWPDDIFWLPKVLGGETINAWFVFGEGDVVKEHGITVMVSDEEKLLV